MKFNALQKYFLQVYAILILFFMICVPSVIDGKTVYGLIFVENSVGEVATSYLALEFLGVTLAAAAVIIASCDAKKK